MDVESAHPPPKFTDSLHSNEEKYGRVEVAVPIDGDVYHDVRAIDLGENGKERPIGAYCLSLFSSAFLSSFQKLMSMSPHVSSLSRMTPPSLRLHSECGS